MYKGNQNPLRTPGDFNPRMISTPRPGFTSTFGTFGMRPRTPFRPYTPIPSNSPEYGQYSPEYTLAPGQDPADTIPQALLPEYMSPRPRAPEYMSPRPWPLIICHQGLGLLSIHMCHQSLVPWSIYHPSHIPLSIFRPWLEPL